MRLGFPRDPKWSCAKRAAHLNSEGAHNVLKIYRDVDDTFHAENGPLPDHVIWIDLLDPTPEEKSLVEDRAKIRIPSKEALSEIEATSRLIVEHGTLYLSAPIVSRGDLLDTHLTPIGFVVNPQLLVTVRYTELPTFDAVAKLVHEDEALASSFGVFVALLEAIVDKGADVLEHLGTAIDGISKSVFKSQQSASNSPAKSNARLREALSSIGAHADRLAQARDVLLGVGRIASFASDICQEHLSAEFKTRLIAVSKDVASLNEYETHLSDKVQFLLDAVLGYISIEQNDLFKVLTIVSVVGVPPTLLAGIWGMNFKVMPELNWSLGYPLAWLAIVLSAIAPLVWFKRRGWF